MFARSFVARILIAAGAILLCSRPAVSVAATACVAADFGCPAEPATCVISGTWHIPDDCDLDFGTQNVEIVGTLKAEGLGDSFSIEAADLTLTGATVKSPGDLDDWGGDITIDLTGHFEQTAGTILTSGGGGGGTIDLTAASISILGGTMKSDGGSGEDNCGDASEINLLATSGPVVVDGNGTTLTATTSGYHCSGGTITIEAPSIEVKKGIDTSGGWPDGIELTATTGDLVLTADAGLAANGRGSVDGSGNDGGEILLYSLFGNIVSASSLSVRGSAPDGYGSDVEIDAAGTVTVDKSIDVGAGGGDAGGGTITLLGSVSVTVNDSLSAKATNGDSEGGDVSVESQGPILFSATSDVDVEGGVGSGGDIEIETPAAVTIAGAINTKGTGGGDGGTLDITGCQVDLSSEIDARSTGGGGEAETVYVTAATIHVQATATIDATPCPAGDCIDVTLPSGSANIDPGATLDPTPVQTIDPALKPCCGNGTVDDGTGGTPSVGEDCDDSNGVFCDGCTPACTLEPACADDGNECTLDCNPAVGCAYQPQTGTACTDEPDACTDDVCQSGACTHDPITCNDGIACTIDSCDSVAGCQVAPDDAVCDDGEACTTETCDVIAGCASVNVPDATPCDDGSLCTLDDACQDGACTGSAPDCDDGDECTLDACNPIVGCFNSEDPATCGCTDEGGLPLAAGSSCVDGVRCTVGDTCDGAGTCDPGPICPDVDGNPCTQEICFLGLCATVDDQCPDCIEGLPCSDGLTCTIGTCQGGACVSDPVSCDDGDSCTSEQCVHAIGCVTTDYSAPACTPEDPPLDHFTCYKARKSGSGAPVFTTVPGLPIEDEFWSIATDVTKLSSLCLPANKNGEDPTAPTHEDHLEVYKTKAVTGTPKFVRQSVEVVNQFGTLLLDAKVMRTLMVPTSKSLVEPPSAPVPPDPDHFTCYRVARTSGAPKFVPLSGVVLEDQFGPLTVDVKKPTVLCNPANVNGEDAAAPSHPDHLLCYKARITKGTSSFLRVQDIYTADRFGDWEIDAVRPMELCLPSTVTPQP